MAALDGGGKSTLPSLDRPQEPRMQLNFQKIKLLPNTLVFILYYFGLRYFPSCDNILIHSAVDRISKMAYFVIIAKPPLSKDNAQLLLHHVFCLHAIPDPSFCQSLRGILLEVWGPRQSFLWFLSLVGLTEHKNQEREKVLSEFLFLVTTAAIYGGCPLHVYHLCHRPLPFPVCM